MVGSLSSGTVLRSDASFGGAWWRVEAGGSAGFVRAACSLYGLNAPDRDPLLLKRVEVTGFDDAADFTGKASGTWDWYALRQGDPTAR